MVNTSNKDVVFTQKHTKRGTIFCSSQKMKKSEAINHWN
uniref:Uncharacterized protein n=1 Tax=Arundo donax TaxID=35708 RepID=A0A0A9CJU7_ARUDO